MRLTEQVKYIVVKIVKFDDGKLVATYKYTRNYKIQKLVLGGKLTTDYTYDINGNVASLKTYFVRDEALKNRQYNYYLSGTPFEEVENATVFADKQYKYDLNGNPIEKIENGVSTTYQYDSLNRNIKTVTKDGDVQENTYDPLGLRNEVS